MERPEKLDGFPGQRNVRLPPDVIARFRNHPMLRNLMPVSIGVYPKAAGHLRERETGTDEAIFIYCTRGIGWCELGGKKHCVRRGELLVVPPNVEHRYGADEKQPWTIHWFHVIGDHLPLFLKGLGVDVNKPVVFLGEVPYLLGLFEDVLKTFEQSYAPVQLFYAAHALTHLVSATIRRRYETWTGDLDVKQKVAQSIAYMERHVSEPVNVNMLASVSSLSASYYAAQFKEQTGFSPIDYVIRLRMHRACQLLVTTDFTVKTISARLGYQDTLYFSRVFKSVNKVSPVKYRAMHGSQNASS